MKHPFTVEQREFHLPDQYIVYRLYRNPKAENKRRLVLLHGAGVAGVDTWEFIIAFLTQWSEILVPDQRGMGDTHYPDGKEHSYTAQALVGDLNGLVDHLGWWVFDLGGYSLGGLVALLFKQQHSDRVEKQYLLESAVLDRPCWETTIELRQQFSQAALHLRGTAEIDKGIVNFLDAISPNRKVSPEVETLTVQRLGLRPEGFANALDCVTTAIKGLDRDGLVAAQGDVSSFIGGNSVELMHQYQRELAERLPNWHYFLMAGTDHSLPFQKPRQIARIMNDELRRYIEK